MTSTRVYVRPEIFGLGLFLSLESEAATRPPSTLDVSFLFVYNP
jgi:hypothetical protein